MTLSEHCYEYDIAKSTINRWIDKKKEIGINDDEIMDMKKEMVKSRKEYDCIKCTNKCL